MEQRRANETIWRGEVQLWWESNSSVHNDIAAYGRRASGAADNQFAVGDSLSFLVSPPSTSRSRAAKAQAKARERSRALALYSEEQRRRALARGRSRFDKGGGRRRPLPASSTTLAVKEDDGMLLSAVAGPAVSLRMRAMHGGENVTAAFGDPVGVCAACYGATSEPLHTPTEHWAACSAAVGAACGGQRSAVARLLAGTASTDYSFCPLFPDAGEVAPISSPSYEQALAVDAWRSIHCTNDRWVSQWTTAADTFGCVDCPAPKWLVNNSAAGCMHFCQGGEVVSMLQQAVDSSLAALHLPFDVIVDGISSAHSKQNGSALSQIHAVALASNDVMAVMHLHICELPPPPGPIDWDPLNPVPISVPSPTEMPSSDQARSGAAGIDWDPLNPVPLATEPSTDCAAWCTFITCAQPKCFGCRVCRPTNASSNATSNPLAYPDPLGPYAGSPAPSANSSWGSNMPNYSDPLDPFPLGTIPSPSPLGNGNLSADDWWDPVDPDPISVPSPAPARNDSDGAFSHPFDPYHIGATPAPVANTSSNAASDAAARRAAPDPNYMAPPEVTLHDWAAQLSCALPEMQRQGSLSDLLGDIVIPELGVWQEDMHEQIPCSATAAPRAPPPPDAPPPPNAPPPSPAPPVNNTRTHPFMGGDHTQAQENEGLFPLAKATPLKQSVASNGSLVRAVPQEPYTNAYSPAEGSDQDRDRAQANASLPFFKAEPMEWSESFTLGVTVSLLVIGAIFVIVLVSSYWRYLRTHAVEQKFEPPYTPYEGVS